MQPTEPPLPPPPVGAEGPTTCAPGESRGDADDDVDPRVLSRAQSYLAANESGRADPDLASAWADVFLAVEPIVCTQARAARRSGLDPLDAEQEGWAALVESLGDYRPDPARGTFRAWAKVVVRNAQANRTRRRPHTPRHGPPSREAEPADPAEAIERAERVAALRRGLAAFRARFGKTALRIVLLHWARGWSTARIAARLGRTDGQVRGVLARAKPRLRAFLGREIDRD
jgi:RNA polymerase sigma-70 factor (ECF subfamily)